MAYFFTHAAITTTTPPSTTKYTESSRDILVGVLSGLIPSFIMITMGIIMVISAIVFAKKKREKNSPSVSNEPEALYDYPHVPLSQPQPNEDIQVTTNPSYCAVTTNLAYCTVEAAHDSTKEQAKMYSSTHVY